MHPELALAVYRQQEHELEQRLEYRRVALERRSRTGTPSAQRATASRWHLAGRHHPASR